MAFWKHIFRSPEAVDTALQYEHWTRDILNLMMVVTLAATLFIAASVMAGVFTIADTLPIYILFFFTLLSWWGVQHGHWRIFRFFPPVLCFGLGTYFGVHNIYAVGICNALAILLAGMLINRYAQWLLMGISILFSWSVVSLAGVPVLMENTGRLITISFLLVAFSLLQSYYDTKLRQILADHMRLNQSLSEQIRLRSVAEANLRRQEAQLRRLTENTTDLVSEISPEGFYRYVSPSYYTNLGYPPETLVGRLSFELVHPDDREMTRECARRAAEEGQAVKVQSRLRHECGRYLYFETIGTPLFNPAGEHMGFVLSSRNVNRQKLAEEGIQKSEQKFKNIINATPLGIHIYTLQSDGSLIFTDYNPAAEQILEMNHAAMVGKTLEEVFPPLEGTSIPQQYRQTARDGQPVVLSQVPYTAESTSRLFEVNVFQASPGIVAAMFMDITDRIESVQRLKQSEEKFSKIFLNSPDSIVINRVSDGLYLDANSNFTRLTGYAWEEVVGKTSVELGIWAEAGARERFHQALRIEGEVHSLEAAFRLKDGTIKTALISAGLIEINGEACVLSITRSIADRLRAERELREAHLSLAEAYQATLEGWVRALELREHETVDHSRRVVDLTLRMAKKLGIDEPAQLHIQRGALLHDIGKIGVPDHILLKPGPLSPDEWVIMRCHPTHGYELLAPIPYLKQSIDIPLCHHEHWDGSGYPRGLAGEEIPLAARIFAVVDVYDALLSDRSYRPPWPLDQVIRHLIGQKGKQFDPCIVDCFLELLAEEAQAVLPPTRPVWELPANPLLPGECFPSLESPAGLYAVGLEDRVERFISPSEKEKPLSMERGSAEGGI